MVFPDIGFVQDEYEVILEEISKLKEINKYSEEFLRNFVDELRNYDGKLAKLQTKLSYSRRHFTDMQKNYKELQNHRLSMLNLWNLLRMRALNLEKQCQKVVGLLNSSLEYKMGYLDIFEETMRALIDAQEIEESRENRKQMRKLSFLALLVSVIFPYMTLWKVFAIDFLLPIEFPSKLSPYLNWIVVLLLLLPTLWALRRGWIYLKPE